MRLTPNGVSVLLSLNKLLPQLLRVSMIIANLLERFGILFISLCIGSAVARFFNSMSELLIFIISLLYLGLQRFDFPVSFFDQLLFLRQRVQRGRQFVVEVNGLLFASANLRFQAKPFRMQLLNVILQSVDGFLSRTNVRLQFRDRNG